MKQRVFLFGEAEKGEMCTPLNFSTLIELVDRLGNPPRDSCGIDYAIQTLLFNRELIFYRVQEEGFSRNDYIRGLKLLYNEGTNLKLTAICLPGVGDQELIDPLIPICHKTKAFLILSEKDLYDYLTGSK